MVVFFSEHSEPDETKINPPNATFIAQEIAGLIKGLLIIVVP